MFHARTFAFRALAILGFGLSLAACSSDGGSTSDDDDGGDAGGGGDDIAETPAWSVSCDDVCAVVVGCGVPQQTCDDICPRLTLACQGCLADTTCETGGDDCAAVCGSFDDPEPAPTPAPGRTCDALTFSVWTISEPAADLGDAGDPCTIGKQCDSKVCVSGQIGDGAPLDTVSFCASFVECDDPDFDLAEDCPAGWVCAEVPSYDGDFTRSTCVPPDADVCEAGELQWQ